MLMEAMDNFLRKMTNSITTDHDENILKISESIANFNYDVIDILDEFQEVVNDRLETIQIQFNQENDFFKCFEVFPHYERLCSFVLIKVRSN